jgi:hypothetical protein
LLVRSKIVEAPKEVTLAVSAVNVVSNAPLRASAWVDGLEHTTPYIARVEKDSVHEVRVQPPEGFLFEGWSDNIGSPERTLTCDIDTTLSARFRPLRVGTRLWEGAVELGKAYETFREQQQEEANQVRLEVALDYPTYLKHSGALGMLIKPQHQANIAASGGSKLGLNQFKVQMEGPSDKSSLMKSSITQLRDYLENVTVTLTLRLGDYQRLGEIVSLDAFQALKQAQGELRYQVQLRGTQAREEGPKRTIDALMEGFKRES